jgi:ethanolamine utilization protein EutP (predicted NTPase)
MVMGMKLLGEVTLFQNLTVKSFLTKKNCLQYNQKHRDLGPGLLLRMPLLGHFEC